MICSLAWFWWSLYSVYQNTVLYTLNILLSIVSNKAGGKSSKTKMSFVPLFLLMLFLCICLCTKREIYAPNKFLHIQSPIVNYRHHAVQWIPGAYSSHTTVGLYPLNNSPHIPLPQGPPFFISTPGFHLSVNSTVQSSALTPCHPAHLDCATLDIHFPACPTSRSISSLS